ncbi:T-cell-specific guanine nucleotide triphosphate-binding protein 2-like [Mya arenaria]|uniref:T-cell-specific guanine nucleotide triphosphate-binding protein 2-like n=1 Tax=Mya arenaria TaxID=6604 RepID=UPI0022E8ACBB|nr:T-cell-specific guanine nucleotide triphosphate-binding protein 2-like [Mya arenaria]
MFAPYLITQEYEDYKLGSDILDNLDVISDTETEEYKRILKETGYTALCKKLEEPINGWEKVQINIAVTGEPGTGKSSFINSIRGLEADDPGAAEVSLFETTMNLSGYPHPDNPNLRIWDLPYVGELTFTRDNYLQKAALNCEDGFANFYTRFGIIEPKIWHSLPLIGNMLKVKAHQKEGAFILKEFLDMCAKETHDLQMYMAKALEGSEF